MNNRGKRGPYKQYLRGGGSRPVPRSTLYRWRTRQQVHNQPAEENPREHEGANIEDENYLEPPNNAEVDVNSSESISEHDESSNSRRSSDDENEGMADSSIGALLADPKMQAKIYQRSSVTLMFAMIILSSFVTRYSLTKEAVQHLLDIIALLLPADSILPKTYYYFKKFMPPSDFIVAYFCPLCSASLQDAINGEFKCTCGESSYSVKQLIDGRNYYLRLPLVAQLRHILEDCKLGNVLYDPVRNPPNPNRLSDIYDGMGYIRYANGKLLNPLALSLIMNTDGVPIFKSSNSSIWPVLSYIVELPSKIRKKYMMLCALWFGSGKPNLNAILRGFVNEMKILSEIGFEWRLNNVTVKSTVDLLAVCVDAVARAPLQNFLQFNGHFGCSWCEQPGHNEQNCHVYKFLEVMTRRCKETVAEYARRATELTYPVMGVIGPSILSELPNFDIVNGVLFDSMHCMDLGVMRQLANLWFTPSNWEKDWYIGRQADSLNKKIRSINPPSNITRLPRGINCRINWKSHEWRNFNLYYGPFILQDSLPRRYYKNFVEFSEATFLLNQNTITQNELYTVRQKIISFVKKFEQLYGVINMTFNIHQLLHACDCVSLWGPLWAYSAYSFEDQNGKLLHLFNGTQAIDRQIVNRFSTLQKLKILSTILADTNNDFSQIMNSLLGHIISTKNIVKIDDIVFVGRGKPKTIPLIHYQMISNHANYFIEALSFEKVLFNGNLFSTSSYKEECRRKNCFVMLVGGIVCKICSMYALKNKTDENSISVFIGESMRYTVVIGSNNTPQIVCVDDSQMNTITFQLSDVISKCVLLRKYPISLAVLANLTDRD